MAYSLGIRCLAEFLGMMIVIYTGEAALANELLPSTKGHAMGWGWTVFTFGFAFLAPLHIFGKVSAKLNPAMCLAQWVWGNLTGVDFVCLSLAEFAGAFVGAVLHWIHFLPHYKTLPEPAALDKDDNLLRRRDVMKESALQIASYATRPDRKVTSNPLNPLRHTLYYLRSSDVIHEETPSQVLSEYYHMRDPLHRRASVTGPAGSEAHVQPLARKTIQVADLQRHLRDAHVEKVLRQRTCPKCHSGAGSSSGNFAAAAAGDDTHVHSDGGQRHVGSFGRSFSADVDRAGAGAPAGMVVELAGLQGNGGREEQSSKRDVRFADGFDSNTITAEKQRANALYQAAVVADQNAKLSIFATRPAIYSPLYNFITEVMGTVALLLLVLLIEMQARRFPEGSDVKLFYEVGIQYFLICQVIVVLIAGLGGPTAYAANPARDLGPRLAHALLPIPGKGSSEWSYAWIPGFAPLVGGVIAGVLYIAIEEMQFPGGGTKGGGGNFVG
uniref:Aquaporin n=1 Tax=Tetradesmus obliquus TaxID=3088 RepID=A0A383VRT2_TETOB|eukprot:jgi/Sobl393_1/14557/SZX68227.1